MGVYGLWRLLDATGKQVPLQTLEGKVLAVDISIWIHQVLQGYQDRFGNPKPNAHLIGLFSRICKLLYYKIKPVFVFDGGVPLLKKDTIALRRKQKSMAKNKAQQMRIELINNLIKHSAVKTVLNPEEQNVTSDSNEMTSKLQNKQRIDDMYKLPDMPSTSNTNLNLNDDYDSDSSLKQSPRKQTKWIGNIHSVDVTSAEFKALPADVRHEILTDLKETRKQNSWGRLHEMPEESHEFSGFQMKRLLKRRLVQQSLESAEKEMGGKTLTLDELDKLLTEQGITTNRRDCTYRIAGDSTTRLIYISNKNAYIEVNSNDVNSKQENNIDVTNEVHESITNSNEVPIHEDINEYEFDDEWDSDIEITTTINNPNLRIEISSNSESETELNESRPLSKKYFGKNVMNPALTYMLEYSGLTEKQILTLLEQNRREDRKNVENASKTLQQTDSLKTRSSMNTDNVLNIRHETSISESDKKFEELISKNAAKPIHVPTTELCKSETKSNTNLLPSPTSSNTLNDEPIVKSPKSAIMNSTDSDSDDFIEIEDVPILDTFGKTASQKNIQIMFRADQEMKDDMFADIFEASNDELNAKAESRNISLSNDNLEELVKNFPDRRETENKVISEESVVELAKNETEGTESSSITKMNNTEEQIMEIDTSIINKDTQSKKDETEETNRIEIVSDSEKSKTDIMQLTDTVTIDIPVIDDSKKIDPLPVNEEELLSLKTQLEVEQTELMLNIGKLERQGVNISQRIRIEAQELLRLCGVPYIVAPMEAEAQCAYLEQIHLTEGTITDDSDIWLFGGQCVYKNFFANNKKVLQFHFDDIQHHFKLTRDEMIRLALLVGSDYTMGVTGIGPVTALEILAAFPSVGDNLLQGLTNFCSWLESGRAAGPGRATLRNKLQNVKIHKGFPNQAVAQAYLFPEVDESKEGFTWGKPNTLLLSNYAKQKFGWNKTKFDQIMAPILKRLEEKQNQKLIDAYFKVQNAPKSIEMNLSKRVQKAVQRLNNHNMEESETLESTQQQRRQSKKRAPKSSEKKETANKLNVNDSIVQKIVNVSVDTDKNLVERIPQKEKDKAEALKKRLHAIEVLRKSKQGLCKTKKVKRCTRKVKDQAELSESDSSSS